LLPTLWKLLGVLANAVKQGIDPLDQRKFGNAPAFAYDTWWEMAAMVTKLKIKYSE
jgi:hypothetical protein